eukprot:3970180-Amphidinium_carterae.1
MGPQIRAVKHEQYIGTTSRGWLVTGKLVRSVADSIFLDLRGQECRPLKKKKKARRAGLLF